MNPDVFQPHPPNDTLSPFVRRIMVAHQIHPIDMTFDVPATGYCYIGWVPRGRWQGWVNGHDVFDSDVHGRLHLSGQIEEASVVCSLSGKLIQLFAELTATGQYELFHLPGIDTVNLARRPPFASQAILPENVASIEELLDVFQAYLGKLVLHAKTVPEHVRHAVNRIEGADGDITITEICEEISVSDRQLRRDFHRIVGLRPKGFARALQINASLMSLLAMGDDKLADIATRHGFADQAHMTRSFAEFIGRSPKLLSQDIEPTLAKFVGQSRAVR